MYVRAAVQETDATACAFRAAVQETDATACRAAVQERRSMTASFDPTLGIRTTNA